jgi:hypothetical protein
MGYVAFSWGAHRDCPSTTNHDEENAMGFFSRDIKKHG